MLRWWPCWASERRPRRRAARNVEFPERCEGQVWEKTSSAKLSEEVCRRNEGGDVERGADVDVRSLTERLWCWWKPGEAAGWLLWRLKKSSKNLDAELEDLLHHRQSQERQRWRQTDGAAANHRGAASVCSLLFFPSTSKLSQCSLFCFRVIRKTENDPSDGSNWCLNQGRETNLRLRWIFF